jgi:hypothetical protein
VTVGDPRLEPLLEGTPDVNLSVERSSPRGHEDLKHGLGVRVFEILACELLSVYPQEDRPLAISDLSDQPI